jgi:tRNA threonylcarbamoyl adenosine modification protein YeaZ
VSWQLAIETSQGSGGLALRDASGIVHVATLTSKSGVDDQLMPELDRLAREAQCAPMELSLVGVSIGPGGFTGLRIATATAKMLAETTSCSLAAVPSALVCASVWASNEPGHDGPLAVALASKRDTTWLSIIEEGVVTWAGLVDAASAEVHLARCSILLADAYLPGPITDLAKGYSMAIEPPTFAPEATLELALAMNLAGLQECSTTLSPLYPRVPEAVTRFAALGKTRST